MSETFTPLKQQVIAAAQKANDSYALARRIQEQISGLEAQVLALKADLADAELMIGQLQAAHDAGSKRNPRLKASQER